MKLKKIKVKNEKALFSILIIILLALMLVYCNVILRESFARNSFANEAIRLSEENENPIFNIQKILLYSSANVIDKTQDQSLQDLSVYQYTDIAVYIDNTSYIADLTDENTINSLYIDDIKITPNADKGHRYINYKNPFNFGKSEMVEEQSLDRIDYEIINTNDENENHDYSKPTFYTDCSNPISLGYVNKDIITNYSVSDDASKISFNGKVLEETGVNLEEIGGTLSFRINITNKLNQKFSCAVSINLDLTQNENKIFEGYLYESHSTSGQKYEFFKQI